MDTDESDSIIAKIKEEGIELVVLGADFDDPEYGVKEEEKRPDKVSSAIHTALDSADDDRPRTRNSSATCVLNVMASSVLSHKL